MFFSLFGLAAVAYVFYVNIPRDVLRRMRIPGMSKNANLTFPGSHGGITKRPGYATELPAVRELVQGLIVVRCQGGLGNMMFQYASLYGLAKANNLKPYFHCKNTLLYDSFRLTIPRIEQLPGRLIQISGEPCCIYKKQLIELLPKINYLITGYLQSWKYFVDYFSEIRQEFTFLGAVQGQCDKQFRKILKQTDAGFEYFAVGIHARRGDFTAHANARFGHEAAKDNFLKQAVKLARRKYSYLNKKLVFVIAGDDFRWNRAHLNDVAEDVYFLKPVSAVVDMCILSKCNSVIMSSGTYGWWSAFLAKGRVWYEKNFCRPHSELCTEMKEEDFLLSSWMPFSVD